MNEIQYYEINTLTVIGECAADEMSELIDVVHPIAQFYDDIQYTLDIEITNEECKGEAELFNAEKIDSVK
jgi:hypothetical protein